MIPRTVPVAATLAVCVVLLGGCASPVMKATPFYRPGDAAPPPDAARVNLWPLFFQNASALSVLWPLFDATDDHLAVRPFYSLYGRDTGRPVHHVLWPLMRFNTTARDYRVFPFYWTLGSERLDARFVLFPLLWWKANRYSAFIPLYYRRSGPDDGDWLFLSLLYSGRRKGDGGWDLVFPLFFRSRKTGLVATPLVSWRKDDSVSFFNLLGPLYAQSFYPNGDYSVFAPFPFVRVYDRRGVKGSWVWPLYGYETFPHPEGAAGAQWSAFFLSPIFRFARTERFSQSRVWPLYSDERLAVNFRTPEGVIGLENRRMISAVVLFNAWNRTQTAPLAPAPDAPLTVDREDAMNACFPLWAYHRTTDRAQGMAAAQWAGPVWLYSQERTRRGSPEAEETFHWQALWRFLDYERRAALPADAPPSVRATRFNVLWRLYRYVWNADGTRKLDLLFIPVWRAKP